VSITKAVEFPCSETVATAPPQQHLSLCPELLKQRWELRDYQGIELGRKRWRGRWKMYHPIGNRQPE
jgi:hypothetical protein